MKNLVRKAFSTLVLAEHNGKKLAPGVYSAVNAASYFEEPTTILITGDSCSNIAEEASRISDVQNILLCSNSALLHNPPDVLARILAKLQEQNHYKRIIASASNFSKDIIPRLGGILGVQPVSEITKINNENTFTRPCYAGNAIYVVSSNCPLKLITIRASAFDKHPESSTPCPVQDIDLGVELESNIEWVSEELAVSERPELATAKNVVTGGRAFKNKEGFKLVEELAIVLGAAVGATRAAVDADYCANDLQIGQTGKVVAPELYIALGVSGAIQHLAGMKDSKVIVSVNTDADAPIFAISDYSLVGDVFKVVPELIEKLKNN